MITDAPDDKQQPESNEPAEVDEERREGWKDEAGGRATTDSENKPKDEKPPADGRERPAQSGDQDSEGKVSEKEEKEARSE